MSLIKSYGLYAAIIAISGLIAGITIYVHSAERAKAQVIVLTSEKKDLIRKNQTAQIAVDSCMAANLANYNQAEAQRKRADDAIANSLLWDNKADESIRHITIEAKQRKQSPVDCPALDDSFRQWVRSK